MSAEVGVVFCTVVLVTGPIWAVRCGVSGGPGTRGLHLTLTLWLIYISYLMLRRFSTSSKPARLPRPAGNFWRVSLCHSYYFSIWFFRTNILHRLGGGGSLDPRWRHVLLINWAAFLCLAWLVCWTRYRLEVLKREVEEAQALESLHEVSR